MTDSFSSSVRSAAEGRVDPMLPKCRAGGMAQFLSYVSDASDAVQHDRKRVEQFLRDLDQVADDEPCFFTRMGEIIARRIGAS